MLKTQHIIFANPFKCRLPCQCVNFRTLIQVSTQFLKMETLLDDNVNNKIELQIERGGKPLTVDLTVRI